MAEPDIHSELGLRRIVNVSGTMTDLGASIVVPQARQAIGRSLGEFFEMSDLFRHASGTIARLTGAEAGFVTSSSASGITLSVAAAMTGSDLAAIERLPDTSGLKDEVVILAGHMINFGAPVEQMIRLAGAKVVPVGHATSSYAYQLQGAIGERTAAAVYVVSHHAARTEQVSLETFSAVCRAHGVPIIVDAASEYDLRGFLAAGADVAIYSGHKFLSGPTSGIVAGRRELIKAAYLQNRGIGRAMKIGKEGIIGVMAALEAWEKRDHAAIRQRERSALDLWLEALSGKVGISARLIPDPTGNPLDRLEIHVDPELANITAWDLAARLASGDRPVMVRDMELEHGIIELDPCNLHEGDELIVAERIVEELMRAASESDPVHTPIAAFRQAQEKSIADCL